MKIDIQYYTFYIIRHIFRRELKQYLGVAVEPRNRFRVHRNHIKNRNCPYAEYILNNGGLEDWEFVTIYGCYCDKSEAHRLEGRMINIFRPQLNTYKINKS